MKLSRTVLLITGAAALAGAAGYGLRAWAEGTPKDQPLLYRGTLLNPDGTPLAGSHQIVVSLFAQETMGDPLCASAASSVDLTATRGQFRVPLAAGAGAATPDCAQIVHQYSDLWVGVSVDGTMFPRSKLGSVPYALEADHAITAKTAQDLDTPDKILGQVNQALMQGGKLTGVSAGLPGYEIIQAPYALPEVTAGGGFPQANWTALCSAGKKLLGGGCATNHAEWMLWISSPNSTLTGWSCWVKNISNALTGQGGSGAANATAYAICDSIP